MGPMQHILGCEITLKTSYAHLLSQSVIWVIIFHIYNLTLDPLCADVFSKLFCKPLGKVKNKSHTGM